MKERILRNKATAAMLVIMFLFYTYVAWNIPCVSSDDYHWGIHDGWMNFLTAAQNSRYMGNLVTIIITRSQVLKTLIMSVTFTLLPLMMVRLTEFVSGETGKAEQGTGFAGKYLLASALLLAMPAGIWADTYGWVSGFPNYVLAVVVLLGNLIALLKTADKEPAALSSRAGLLLALLSFSGTLFLEIVSIYLFLIYLAANVWYLLRSRSVHKGLVWLLAGAAAGCVVMFCNGIITSMLTTGQAYDGYRQMVDVPGDGLLDRLGAMAHNYLYTYVNRATTDFTLLTILAFAGGFVSTYKSRRGWKLLWTVHVLALAVYAAVWIGGVFIPYRYKILYSLAYFVWMTIMICSGRLSGRRRFIAAGAWVSALLITVPLSLIQASGGRLLFIPMVFQIITIIHLLDQGVKAIPGGKIPGRVALAVTAAAVCLLLCWYANVYTVTGNEYRERMSVIESSVSGGASGIRTETFTYTQYLHGDNPFESNWTPEARELYLFYFREYYGIPQDVDIYFYTE